MFEEEGWVYALLHRVYYFFSLEVQLVVAEWSGVSATCGPDGYALWGGWFFGMVAGIPYLRWDVDTRFVVGGGRYVY